MIHPGDTKQGGSTSTQHSTRQYSPDNPSSPPSPMTNNHLPSSNVGTDLLAHIDIDTQFNGHILVTLQ